MPRITQIPTLISSAIHKRGLMNPCGKFRRNRQGQKTYRKNLIERFGICPLTGVNYKLCEAAHILPYSECIKKKDKFSLYNGILLSATMHKAFDRNYFTIDEKTCKVKLLLNNMKNDDIKNPKEIDLDDKEGIYIQELDNPESKRFIKERNKLNLS